MWREESLYSVVVADDEEELRRALIQRVDWESAGFRVIGEAENGADAVSLVESLQPDLLLADIRMPFVSGIEMARQVREIRPATQIAFLSGYDEFSYAQQAIQYNIIAYLLKPISAAEMLVELKNIKQKIDEQFLEFSNGRQQHNPVDISEFLMPLVLDGCISEAMSQCSKQVREEAIRFGLLKDTHTNLQYIIMVVSIYKEDRENQTNRAFVNAVDTILRKYVRHTSFYILGRVVSLLMASPLGFERYLHILVDDITQSVSRILECNAIIGISRPVPELVNVHEAYVEAMNAIYYSRKNGLGVVFIADLERTDAIDLEQIQSFISELEHVMRGGNSEELEQLLEHFFERMEKNLYSATVGRFLLSEINSSVLRLIFLVAGQDGVLELQQTAPIPTQTFDYSEELRTQYVNFCQAARELVLEQRKKSSLVLCDRAMEYLDRHFMDQDISLVVISNEIAVSPNYLSALIRKTTGKTFVDLLTGRRIETAITLLQNSTMKIREIAEKCGYSDQHYFSYSFKKYTGMSPLAYRQHAQKGDR